MNNFHNQVPKPTMSKLKCIVLVDDCTKLASSTLCFLIQFIWYKLPSRSTIETTLLSIALTMQSFRLKCTFKPLDKNLLIERNLFAIWAHGGHLWYKSFWFYLLLILQQQWIQVCLLLQHYHHPNGHCMEQLSRMCQNAAHWEVMCFIASKFMIHLHMTFACVSSCIAKA